MSSQTLYFEHDGQTHEVEPLGDGTESVSSFYSWDDPSKTSANTGLEIEDTSQMFFYHGSNGISLVFIHDIANDDDGGTATINFGSPPTDLSWVVRDDPGIDGPGGERGAYSQSGASWRWGYTRTDGGAVRGGFDGEFHMSVSASFSGIDSWVFRDGTGGTITLDTSKAVTLASRQPTFEVSPLLDFEFCTPTGLTDEVCLSSNPVGSFQPRNCKTQPGGETPPMVSTEITYTVHDIVFDLLDFEKEIQEVSTTLFWIGIETEGQPCLWVGNESLRVCKRIEESCDILEEVEDTGEWSIAEAQEIADDVVAWLTENTAVERNSPTVDIIAFVVFVVVLVIVIPGPNPI